VRAARIDQSGPARIVTLSRNSTERNFTLGQEGDALEARLRTTKTSANGMPGLLSKPKSLRAELTHVVYAHGGGSQKVFVQRLTVPEYIETVRSTVGVDIAKEAREILPRDLRADGFSNTAYNLNVDLGHIEAYAKLAEIIAGRIDIKALATRNTKSRELSDENVTKVVEPVGRRLLRGPLSKEEVARYCGISTSVAAAGGNFEDAIRYIVEAMLQSPRFIYRIEQQRGDGSPRPVSGYELASRLSYIVWGGPPDDALLAAAEKGTLDRAGVESQVRRMLQDPRAVQRSRHFISDWLNLDRLANLRPSAARFPRWDAQLAADMREEARLLRVGG